MKIKINTEINLPPTKIKIATDKIYVALNEPRNVMLLF